MATGRPYLGRVGAREQSGRGLFLGALGVVFGDIGTSPLYAIREAFFGLHPVPPTEENVLGVLSLVAWSLALIVSLKYLTFVLRANNRGEGGIFALFSLLEKRTPLLTLLALLGAALLYGDGIITPAISVLSAVEGLGVATSALDPFVLPLTVAILVLLFSLQRRGTTELGPIFGRVMELWFLALALLGIRGILLEPSVLSALDPRHALAFFGHNGFRGFLALGAVVLCVTGAEALFADLGHFGPGPIRRAWSFVVFPALLLNYAGQAAVVLHAPEPGHPFYALVPSPLLYPMVLLATVAAIIASQAVIAGAFSLTRQASQLGFLPRVRIVHTSPRLRGQIFVPSVNLALGVACIAAVLFFRGSTGLAAAYGVAVTATMAITSFLFYFAAREHLGWPRLLALPLVALFLAIDLGYFAANFLKIPDGGWLPILVAVGLVFVMLTWWQGRRVLAVEVAKRSMPIDVFLDRLQAARPERLPGTAVFLSSSPTGVPPSLLHHFGHLGVLHERVVFFTAVAVDEPFVRRAGRVDCQDLGQGILRVLAYYGFRQTPDAPDAMRLAHEKGLAVEPEKLRYFLGRETLLPTGSSRIPAWRKKLFLLLSRNAERAASYFRIPPEQVVELGMELEI